MAMTSTTRTPSCTTPDLLLICATRDATSQVSLLVVDRQNACAPRWWRRAERGAPALRLRVAVFLTLTLALALALTLTPTPTPTLTPTLTMQGPGRRRHVDRRDRRQSPVTMSAAPVAGSGSRMCSTSTRAGRGSCVRRWRVEARFG